MENSCSWGRPLAILFGGIGFFAISTIIGNIRGIGRKLKQRGRALPGQDHIRCPHCDERPSLSFIYPEETGHCVSKIHRGIIEAVVLAACYRREWYEQALVWATDCIIASKTPTDGNVENSPYC